MRKRFYLWIGVVIFALVAGAMLFGPAQREDVPQAAPEVAQNEPAAAAVSSKDDEQHESAASVPAGPDDAAPKSESGPIVAQINDQTFRVNASGRLVVDEQTRLNMEALFARTELDHLIEAKQQAIEPLPATASAQAGELLDHYDNYQQAQKQAYPPGVAPATEEAALAELDGLHGLRVAHFGPVVARALYGEEEDVSRQLVEQMRLEKDQSLTLEEKAERAQRLRDSTPRR